MARLLLPVLFALVSSPAWPITLDFTGMATTTWDGDRTEGEVSIAGATVTGGTVALGTAAVDSLQHRGLGALSGDDDAAAPGAGFLDSYGANDAIVFDFGRDVRLDRISFAMADWLDRFDVFVGPDLTYAGTFKAGDLNGVSWMSTVSLVEGLVGSSIVIAAADYEMCGYDARVGLNCWSQGSSFRITAIEYSEMAPIPLPAGWTLMLTALSLGAGAHILRLRRAGVA